MHGNSTQFVDCHQTKYCQNAALFCPKFFCSDGSAHLRSSHAHCHHYFVPHTSPLHADTYTLTYHVLSVEPSSIL